MKIQVTKTSTEELDLQFPISFKQDGCFFHCLDENTAIGIYGDWSISTHTTTNILNDYSPEQNCPREEVEAAFNQAIENMKSIFYGKERNKV